MMVVMLAVLALAVPAGLWAGLHPRPHPRALVVQDDPATIAEPQDPNPTPVPETSEPSSSPESSSSDPTPTPPPSPKSQPEAEQVSLSNNAAVVAFVSRDAIVEADTNGVDDVYVRDRATQRTTLVSAAAEGGPANGKSFWPAVSADGTHVAFVSKASNLVPGDTNGVDDVFVWNVASRRTERVSVSSSGEQGNGMSGDGAWASSPFYSRGPSISADGQRIAFESQASNFVSGDENSSDLDVFVHDLRSGETTLVSATPEGAPPVVGVSAQPAISLDGSRVAFTSSSRELVGGSDPHGEGELQVFIRDLASGVTMQASFADDGSALPGPSGLPRLDEHGTRVAFVTDAPRNTSGQSLILLRDLVNNTTTQITECEEYEGCWAVAMSADASTIAWGNSAGGLDPFCYVTDHKGTVGACSWTTISPEGRYVGFDSGVDPYSLDYDQYGGDFGAMIYDRETDTYVAAYKW